MAILLGFCEANCAITPFTSDDVYGVNDVAAEDLTYDDKMIHRIEKLSTPFVYLDEFIYLNMLKHKQSCIRCQVFQSLA